MPLIIVEGTKKIDNRFTMDIELVKEFANRLQIYLPILTAIILLLSLRNSNKTLAMSKEYKTVDVMLQCQKRYDKIVWDMKERVKKGERETDAFYDRFWNLQLEQFQYWVNGFINDKTFLYWLSCRHNEYNQPDVFGIGENSYRNSFDIFVKKYKVVTDFENLMRGCFFKQMDTLEDLKPFKHAKKSIFKFLTK